MPLKLRVKVRCDIFVYVDVDDDEIVGEAELLDDEWNVIKQKLDDAVADFGTVVKSKPLLAAIININPLGA